PTATDAPVFAGVADQPLFPVTVTPGAGSVRCVYRLDHLAEPVAHQFVRHLAHVHEQVVRAPETLVADVELLDDAERSRVAALGRPARPLVSTPATVPERFRVAAAATPDAVAVTDGTTRLTYAELDHASDLMASGLRALGVRDGDRVGVCLERTAELVVSLIGVVKAGAAYVPTDPNYPAERLAYTARDAGLRVVVTRLPAFPAEQCRTPDEVTTAADGTVPTPDVAPGEPAYVIYTSGSTGRPKGVVVPHRNVISLVDATRGDYGLGASDVWSMFHSSAFDVSVYEMWGCLLTGGRLVVVPYFVSRDPERFRDLLVAERVTVLSQTPSAFAQLLPVDHRNLATRLVIFAGEPLDARMLLPWFEQHPDTVCRMVNMFGITETTVHTTVQTVSRDLALAASKSVGPALPGWHLYVMDQAGRLVPPGVVGEIYVGGAGVALHYLNQPDLTRQRFLPDPFTGGRMYRSGDLGRLRPDGCLEHLGRMDNQVKIRGFRIELDEIRTVLLEDPAVSAATVVVRRTDHTDARLDAYVVFHAGSTDIDPTVVRARAAGILPDYMVPTTVTAVASFPLTTNGKLDTAKLPAPVVGTTSAAKGTPTADDALAESLQDVWSSVLGVPVGVDDDFFDLGGNSVVAVRLGTALRATGLPAIKLRELYRHPTIRATVAALTT
ncbi:MAG TPA: non-ribosomal peptide synthetase, partial [Pseudonocardiaceae bacterium]|nr:non-ribosomal peptide synthetase [Pseudonocardiaceae bacterium]